jgi:prepilin-type N-terminal cleavage/methylation domain-containing protein
MKIGMPKDHCPETACYTKAQGFTLFEVILVLAIIAVLTAAILTRNNPSAARTRLFGQADLLKSQLRYAQARSMNADSVWGIKAQGNNVLLFNGGDAVNLMYLPGENTKTLTYNTGDLSGLSVSDFTLSFDDRGRPCSDEAGTSLRPGSLSITLSDTSGPTANIDVTPNTGFIQ